MLLVIVFFFFFFSSLPITFARALQIVPFPSPDNNSIAELLATPATSTNFSAPVSVGCFRKESGSTLLPTNKGDCEAALDNWVRGQDLVEPRTFSPKPSYHLQDIHLPLTRSSGTCVVYFNMANPTDQDTLTLAEVYAEILGPNGLAKNCLGQRISPALGGTMKVGTRQMLIATVTGRVNHLDDVS